MNRTFIDGHIQKCDIMPAYTRREIVDETNAGVYHCVSRRDRRGVCKPGGVNRCVAAACVLNSLLVKSARPPRVSRRSASGRRTRRLPQSPHRLGLPGGPRPVLPHPDGRHPYMSGLPSRQRYEQLLYRARAQDAASGGDGHLLSER